MAPIFRSADIIIQQQHNAAHHAPAREMAFDDMTRVAGRVHALVRLRPPLAHLPPPRPDGIASDPRHASRYPHRRGQAGHYGRRRFGQAAASPAVATCLFSKRLYRPSNLTPGITRRPKPLLNMRAVVWAVGCMPLLDAAEGKAGEPTPTSGVA